MVTAQVQEAARKVFLENRRLRALLAERGVPTAEIGAFLQSQAATSADLEQPAETRASDATNQRVLAASPPAMPMDVGFEGASEAGKKGGLSGSSNDTELLRPGEQSESDSESGSLLPNLLGPVSDCYCPDVDPVPGQAPSSETECSVAAHILAGFRGHGDVGQALVELGCPDTAQCSMTNAALLLVLDSEHASNTQPCNAHATVTH